MVGDTLRRARESQNLTVKDIEKGTSIRSLYIEAIEKGEYGTLPGMVYAKGFVRNYANFLKLDADTLARQFQEEADPGSTAAEPPKEEEKPRKVSSADFSEHYTGGTSSSHTGLVAMLLVLVVAAGGVWYLLSDSGSTAHSTKQGKQTAQTTQSKSSPKPQAQEQQTKLPAAARAQEPSVPSPTPQTAPPSKTAPAASPAASGELVLDSKFTGNCWVQVVADGQVVYEGTAQEGQSMHWTAKEHIFLTAGNAGAVELTQNGKPLGTLGAYGQVVEKDFTRTAQAN